MTGHVPQSCAKKKSSWVEIAVATNLLHVLLHMQVDNKACDTTKIKSTLYRLLLKIFSFSTCNYADQIKPLIQRTPTHGCFLQNSDVFETRTATGSELFPFQTCLHTTTFILLSIFSPSETISLNIVETVSSWHSMQNVHLMKPQWNYSGQYRRRDQRSWDKRPSEQLNYINMNQNVWRFL